VTVKQAVRCALTNSNVLYSFLSYLPYILYSFLLYRNTTVAVKQTVRCALSNSFGFGGTNATLAFVKAPPQHARTLTRAYSTPAHSNNNANITRSSTTTTTATTAAVVTSRPAHQGRRGYQSRRAFSFGSYGDVSGGLFDSGRSIKHIVLYFIVAMTSLLSGAHLVHIYMQPDLTIPKGDDDDDDGDDGDGDVKDGDAA
jgi:hypothetical protein